MKTEKRFLIDELMNDGGAEARRNATLLGGRRILRRKRWIRASSRVLMTVAVLTLGVVAFRGRNVKQAPASADVPAAPSSGVNYLTDDQLLALFPDTAVGLATVGERKVLIFPRADDRERFVGRF